MNDQLLDYNSIIINTLITGYGIMHQYIERSAKASSLGSHVTKACYDYLDKTFCTKISQECPILDISSETFAFVEKVSFRKTDMNDTEYEVWWTETDEIIDMVEFAEKNLAVFARAVFVDSHASALIDYLINGDKAQQLFSIVTMIRNIYSRVIFSWMLDVYEAIPTKMKIDISKDENYHALSCMINLWWDFLTNMDPFITVDKGSHLLPPSTPSKSSFIGKLFMHPVITVQRTMNSQFEFQLYSSPSRLKIRY